MYSNKILILIETLLSTRTKKKSNLTKWRPLFLIVITKRLWRFPQTLYKRGVVTLAIANLIQSFISSNDSGIGGTNTLLFTFQLANFHFKMTSTLTTFGAIMICHDTSKSYIHLNIFAFENFSFLSHLSKNRLTQKVFKLYTSNFEIKNKSTLS